MLDYYNREQYGRLTNYLRTKLYRVYLDNNGIQKNEDGSLKLKNGGCLGKNENREI